MKEMPSYGLKVRHPLLYRFGVLTGITICVYLVFRYLLHLFLPFILAYLLMRMLFPVIWFLRHHCHFPKCEFPAAADKSSFLEPFLEQYLR